MSWLVHFAFPTFLIATFLLQETAVVQAGEVFDHVIKSGILRVPNNSSWPPILSLMRRQRRLDLTLESPKKLPAGWPSCCRCFPTRTV